MKQRFLYVCGLLLCGLVTHAQTYDVSRDFSLASNPNGAWSYGWKSTLGGTFSLLTSSQILPAANGVPHQIWSLTPNSAPAVKHNATTNTATSDGPYGVYPPGTTWFTAGENGTVHNFGIIRFTVPAAAGGQYRIVSTVRPYLDGPPSNDSDFYVVRNGVQLHGENVPPNTTRGYSNIVTLAAGDVVDFAVGRGLDGLNQGLKIEASLDALSGPPIEPTFDVGEDFSLASNPNGAWSYGWKGGLNESLNLLTAAGQQRSDNGVLVDVWSLTPTAAPAVYHNGTSNTATSDGGQGVYPPGTTWFYPGNGAPQNFGVIRLTVPTGGAGTYRLESAVRPHLNGPPGNDNDYYVFHNATQLHSQNVPLFGSGGYSNTVALSAGDTIDFVVGRGTDGLNAGLKIDARLRLVGTNEPPINSPPTAKAAISPIVDLSPKLTNLLVISVNGATATVTLDGSQSSDPEGGALTYEWFANGSGSPVASGVTANVSLAVGSHEITLAVSDGHQTDTDTVAVEVITINDMIGILVVLVDESGLPRKNSRPLITGLKQAQVATEGDRAHVAIMRLEQFQEKVAAQIAPINEECAELLIDAAQKVIDALSATP